MNVICSKMRPVQVAADAAAEVDRALRAASVEAFDAVTIMSTAAGRRRLRGVPVTGCGGTSPGSDPVRETLRRAEQRRRALDS